MEVNYVELEVEDFFLFIMPYEKKKDFREYFGEKNCIDFNIDFSGTKLIFKG